MVFWISREPKKNLLLRKYWTISSFYFIIKIFWCLFYISHKVLIECYKYTIYIEINGEREYVFTVLFFFPSFHHLFFFLFSFFNYYVIKNSGHYWCRRAWFVFYLIYIYPLFNKQRWAYLLNCIFLGLNFYPIFKIAPL